VKLVEIQLNITASELGVDVDEPFDVSPYAHAMFQFS
jgi:sulfite reductase (ferredoxin)